MTSGNMDPPPCANGCGFYGSTANQNLCSKCYEEILREKVKKSAQAFFLKKAEKIESGLESSFAQLSLSSACDIETSAAITCSASSAKENRKNRCKNCNKKVGLLGFPCRCGNMFCGKHRYPEEHGCKVNLKEIGRQILVQQNPICKADKLNSRA